MSSKKWVLVFLATVLVLAALLAGLNLAVDPFGAFGDRLLSWFSYDETNNPRVAKFSYLEQHHDEYDSYILGCSSTSSFPVDAFNEAYGASFYNLIMYGADMRDCEKIAQYLVEHYEVKNLILNVYLDNGLTYDEESDRLTKNLHYKEDPDTSVLSYYTRYLFADPRYALAKLNALRTDTILPQTFDVFDERTGCYDKRARRRADRQRGALSRKLPRLRRLSAPDALASVHGAVYAERRGDQDPVRGSGCEPHRRGRAGIC